MCVCVWGGGVGGGGGGGCIHSSGAIIKCLFKEFISIATNSLHSVRVVMVHTFMFIF